jgi:hypothetical protein
MDTPDKTPVTNNTITPNHNTEVEIKPIPLAEEQEYMLCIRKERYASDLPWFY